MKICPFCYHEVEQIGYNEYQCTLCETFLTGEDLQEIKIVRFFCLKCGKEMWQGIPIKEIWAEIRELTWHSLNIQLVCSDCLLEEIRRGQRVKEE